MKLKRKLKSFFAMLLSVVLLCSFMLVLQGAKNPPDEEEYVFLPIIMYHSILKDKNLQNDYTISPELFEQDLKYFTDNGFATLTISDLVDYVYSNKPLPSKCIMLTFDDGYYNNYHYAFPLLKKYNCKAVISPIASMTEKFTETKDISVTYGHISADDIKEMAASGLVEFQNHSYDMHKLKPRRGVEQKKGENSERYKALITEDIKKAQDYLKKHANIKPDCFVYPFGAKSDSTEDIVKDLGFISTLTCTEEANYITKSPESLFELGRYRRDNKETAEQLIRRICDSQQTELAE